MFFATQPDPERIPAEFRSWLGRVTAAKTVPQLRQFLEDGGTIITIGTSTSLARHLGLPITSHLVQDGKPLPRTQFYVPGSVLSARVDNTRPVAWGMPERVDVFFEQSQHASAKSPSRRVRDKSITWTMALSVTSASFLYRCANAHSATALLIVGTSGVCTWVTPW